MANRVFNFNPGPATLPLDVLKTVQQELLDYKGTGMSVMEISHRSAEFDEINDTCIALFKEILELDDSCHVLFMGGGASTQFAMVPMNFLPKGGTAAYVDTGSWSSKAIKEAKLLGNVHLAGSSKESKYDHIPDKLDIPGDAAYLHLTSNNTIYGTQYQAYPDTGGVPLVCDMSSDIASRRWDFNKFDLIYAGAQKNLGPAGVTVVIIKQTMLDKCAEGNPTMFNYRTHAEKKSLYNTPPAFPIYIVKVVLEWVKTQGGLHAVEKANMAKKERIYQLMDQHPDYFRGTVQPGSRSWMNITMRLPSEDLEKKFIAEAKTAGMVGLKGHRSVGGIRVSLYNAMPLEGAEKLARFMEEFKKKN
ncbi:MAG: 3-phosphoserine/phosphohydroxythreonine transaminase [Candidatus Zixiibacteriota bacterium]|nr:MAG: 3-phosphoserine/phosphohydroxythreonine transaminase [candidate division Zixibacteria bacterium]